MEMEQRVGAYRSAYVLTFVFRQNVLLFKHYSFSGDIQPKLEATLQKFYEMYSLQQLWWLQSLEFKKKKAQRLFFVGFRQLELTEYVSCTFIEEVSSDPINNSDQQWMQRGHTNNWGKQEGKILVVPEVLHLNTVFS